MSRSIHKLTPERVKNAASKKLAKTREHGDGGGLYLRLTVPPPSKDPEKAKAHALRRSAPSWVFRYMLAGKARQMGLGSYPEIDLPTAREKAKDARELKAKGIDPIEERERQRAAQKLQGARAMTFRQCAAACIEAKRPGWKNAKHAAQWTATLERYAYPVLGDVAVSDADTPLVCRVLEPIWTEKTETASRVRGRIEVILDWAKTRGYRSGENPARWRGHMENLFAARSTVHRVEHHPALPYQKLPAFMADLADEEGIGADALRFTILTAVRTDQTTKAKWPEIDFADASWTVPGPRMKGKKGREREHRVPLSKPVLALLRRRHADTGGHGYVFPGQNPKKHLSNGAMLALLERMGRDEITVHGFRSTFRDWVEEETNYAGTLAEAALAHVVGDKVEAAYRRGDLLEKRRKLMNAWATFCTSPVKDADVIPIRKGSSA